MISARFAFCLALFTFTLAIAVAVPAQAGFEGASPSLTIHVQPSAVDIGINYQGARVNLGGVLSDPAQIAIKVASSKIDKPVSKKNRVAGIIWMANQQAKVKNIPSLFAIYSSAPLLEILAPDDLEQTDLDPTFGALLSKANVVSNDAKAEPIQDPLANDYLLGLRDVLVAQGLYFVREREVDIHGSEWAATLDLPAAAPPGSYEVTAYAIADKRVIATANATFEVRKAGVVDLLSELAHEHPPVYGTMAILAAICVGLGVGRLFGGSGH